MDDYIVPTVNGGGGAGRRLMRDSSLMGMESGGSNPYDQFKGEEDTTLPSQYIHMGGSANPDLDPKKLPDSAHIIMKFEEHIEVMAPLSDEEEDKLRRLTIEEKWKIIFNEQTRDPISPVDFYTDALRRQLAMLNDRKKPKGSLRKSNKDQKHGAANSLALTLRKLKLDLKMSFDSFIEKFVSESYNGIQLLLAILEAIQIEQTASMSLSRKNRAEQYKQTLLEEYDCLLCIKFAFRLEKAVPCLLKRSDAIDTISMCLMSHFRKTTTVALEILTAACSVPQGHSQVEDTMTRQRIKFGESVRFKMVVSMLHSGSNFHFQAVCLRFFNKLWSCSANSNTRVYFQQELHLAGFDPDQLDRPKQQNPLLQEVKRQSGEYSMGDSPEFDELQRELDIWRKNYIDITIAREGMTELETRNTYLRQEIDRLSDKILEITQTKTKLEQEQGNWKEKCDRYRERAAALQDTVEKLTHEYEEKLGKPPSEVDLEEANRALDMYTTVRGLPRINQSSDSLDTLGREGAMNGLPEPPPVPAPPPVPPAFLSQTVRKKVVTKSNLPMFNWTPIYSIRKTIFEDIDDEAKLREIDFTDFEEQFQLPVREESRASKDRRERAIQRVTNKIHFVDNNRAKNMIITKKRTGLSAKEIKDAVDQIDVEKLPGEYAELLLKYVPTKEEVKQLAAHAHEYSHLGEAEQLLFQMAQVDRLESRLSMLAFIGIFDELINSVKPQMERLYLASTSVKESTKLKKVFEIILAFGNYMNSSKRGYALGYKLESLIKLTAVKSKCKKKTLMNYIAWIIEANYPELMNFFDELDIEVDRGVSYQAIASDLQGLRKGIDLIKYEMDRSHHKHPGIDRFQSKAAAQVAEIAEAFKKMQEAYRIVCQLFGENYKDTEPEEIFRYISMFVVSYKEAMKENHKTTSESSGTPVTSVSSTPRGTPLMSPQLKREPSNRKGQAPKPPQRSSSMKRSRPESSTKNFDTPSKDKPIGAKNIDVQAPANTRNVAEAKARNTYDNVSQPSKTSFREVQSSPRKPEAVALRREKSNSMVFKAKRDSTKQLAPKPPPANPNPNPNPAIPNGAAAKQPYVTRLSVKSGGDLVARTTKSHSDIYESIDDSALRDARNAVSTAEIGVNGPQHPLLNGHALTRGKYTAQEMEALDSLNEVIDNFDPRPAQENAFTAL